MLSDDFAVLKAVIHSGVGFMGLSDLADTLENATVIFVAQLFSELLQCIAAHTRFQNLQMLFADGSKAAGMQFHFVCAKLFASFALVWFPFALQLPDRISTITEGILFLIIGRSLF